MLDRIRFQEIEKAVFRTRGETQYGNKHYCEGEPFLIVDNASISNFSVGDRNITDTGRSVEATTSTVRRVSFHLTNGQTMLDLFNTVFGKKLSSQSTTYTVEDVILLEDTDVIDLPSEPVGDVLLYLTDDYGYLTKIAKDQYEVDGGTITFIKPISRLITYCYETEVKVKEGTSIRQIGADIIGSLEMQCIALDTLTEEKIRILMKFEKVSVSTTLSISFNNSGKASSSTIYVTALPDDLQNDVNKEIFTIEVV